MMANKKRRAGGKWMPLDEAVRHIMTSKKCTHDEAMNILAISVQSNKVKARKVPISPPDHLTLSGSEAAEMFARKSESAYMTLGYFINIFGFSLEDIQGELAAGRLIASASAATRFQSLIGEKVPANAFEITMKDLREWMTHPETPPHLIEQMVMAMRQPNFGDRSAFKPLVIEQHTRKDKLS
jgi:hypothetical protein